MPLHISRSAERQMAERPRREAVAPAPVPAPTEAMIAVPDLEALRAEVSALEERLGKGRAWLMHSKGVEWEHDVWPLREGTRWAEAPQCRDCGTVPCYPDPANCPDREDLRRWWREEGAKKALPCFRTLSGAEGQRLINLYEAIDSAWRIGKRFLLCGAMIGRLQAAGDGDGLAEQLALRADLAELWLEARERLALYDGGE